jgi:nucleolar protein 56
MTHLPATKSAKKQKFLLGISDVKLGQDIQSKTGFTASFNESITELIRGIRTHSSKLFKSSIKEEDLGKA